MIVDEKVTIKLNEALTALNEELARLSEEKEQIAEEEKKNKEEKIRVVAATNKVFVPYKGAEIIPEKAWNEVNSLRATSDKLIEEEKDIMARKETNARILENISSKKEIVNDAIESYNDIDNNIKDVKPLKEKETKKVEKAVEAPKPIIEDVYKLETPVEDTINNVANETVVVEQTPALEDNVVSFQPVEEEKPMVKAM